MTTTPTLADPVQAVLYRLADVKAQSDQQWIALCPSHTDKKPSLSVGVGDDGKVLLRCQAGCALDDVLAAMNPPMSMSDLFPKGTTPNGRKHKRCNTPPKAYPTFEQAVSAAERQTRGKHADTWTYHKANGDGHFRIARFELPNDKTFRPFHRTKRGWVQADPSGKLSLYSLPELLDIDTGEVVDVFEGEKCADAARKLGLTATTSAHGCQSPQKSDWQPLAGKQIRVWPDADDGGRKFATTVAGIVRSLDPTASVKIVDLLDLEEHGDIVDFIEDRRTDAKDDDAIRAELLALAELAPEWEAGIPAMAYEPETATALAVIEPYRNRQESMRAINEMATTSRQLREMSITLAEQVARWFDRRGPETLDGIDYPVSYAAAAIGVSRCYFHRLNQIGRVRRLLPTGQHPVAMSDRAIRPLTRLLVDHPEAIPRAVEAANELVKAEAVEQERTKPKPVSYKHTTAVVDEIIGPVEKADAKHSVIGQERTDADFIAIQQIRHQIADLADAAAAVSNVPPDLLAVIRTLAKHPWSCM